MKKIFLFISLLGFLGTVMLPCDMAAQGQGSGDDPNEISLGYPTANMDVGNLVPMEIVRKVALKKAKDLWGQVTPGEPIACSDQDGNIAYYMCPFYIGKGPFPSYGQIMKGVKEGRALVDAVQSGILPSGLDFSKLQQMPQAVVHSNPDIPKVEKPEPTADSTPNYQKAFKAAKNKELGIGEYGTVYVAATYDRFPIPLISHYLAPYFLTGDLAQQKAKESLLGSPKLNRIYFLGIRGTYFEFASGNNAVTIHAYSLESEPIRRIQKRAPLPQHLQSIREHWDTLIKDAEIERGGDQ